ncbi:hypothetical protein AB0387_19890 [Streptomyces sp. NPDC089173]|uniref:hypothetical protein n=1 Tax=Streptomyces sp. NPDC089173 TaxID=3154965 RepID=UPI00344B441A
MTNHSTPEQPAYPYFYTDGQNHRLVLRTTADAAQQPPYVGVEVENLALGGAVVSMWLTLEQVAHLDAALCARREFRVTDHIGGTLTVLPGSTWTTFKGVQQASGDEEFAAVQVVVLMGRLHELRKAFTTVAEYARRSAEPATTDPVMLRWGLDDVLLGDDDKTTVLLSDDQRRPYWLELEPERTAALRDALAGLPGNKSVPRVLTPGEHDQAWNAIEGAAGEPDADTGTILNAVLGALEIQAPTIGGTTGTATAT